MRLSVILVLVSACGFELRPASQTVVDPDAQRMDSAFDAMVDAQIDAMIDAPPAVCGNGVLEAGEACEVGTTLSCGTTCGDSGVSTCSSTCTRGACIVTFAPATRWEVTTNGSTWNAVTLPNTNWPCDNCSRSYRTTVCDQPTAVRFRWSSDNRARMRVNGMLTFDQFWLTNYCTDTPCCTKCCDTAPTCLANLSPPQVLDTTDLSQFTAGPNTLSWEVNEEVGGSGFYTEMTVEY